MFILLTTLSLGWLLTALGFESMADPNGHRNSAADLNIMCTVS